MLGLIVRRLLQLPLILAVIFFVTFLLAWVAPGDPLSSADARALSPETRRMLAQRYHVDSPGRFLLAYGRGLIFGDEFHGPPDLGPSISNPGLRVSDIIASGLRVSLTVGLAAIPLAMVIGTAAGVAGGAATRLAAGPRIAGRGTGGRVAALVRHRDGADAAVRGGAAVAPGGRLAR